MDSGCTPRAASQLRGVRTLTRQASEDGLELVRLAGERRAAASMAAGAEAADPHAAAARITGCSGGEPAA